jgi:hypothetical protein
LIWKLQTITAARARGLADGDNDVIAPESERNAQYDYDFIIVGSGFGGSVSPWIDGKRPSRCGDRDGPSLAPDNMPQTTWSLWSWFWRPQLGHARLFSFSRSRDVVVLHATRRRWLDRLW